MKRSLIFLATMVAAGSLSACSKMNMRPTMEADPPETGVDGLVLINELGKAYVLGQANQLICKNFKPSYQEAGKHSYSRYDQYDKDSRKTRSTEDIFACLTFREVGNDAKGKALVLNHLRAGFALSDLYCKNFFRRVSSHSQQRGYARNNTNDVGAAISAILGLSSASPALAGGIGAGFGLADSVFRTYDQQFLISPDLGAVQTRVFSEQAAFARETYKNPPDNLFDATIAISDHANYCSYVGMKRLIGAALVDKSKEKEPIVEDTVARFIKSAETVAKAAADEEARRKAEQAAPAVATPALPKADDASGKDGGGGAP